VRDRPDARVVGQRARGEEYEVLPRRLRIGDDRAAAAAELPRRPRRRREALDPIAAAHEPHVLGVAHEIGGVGRPVRLLAPLAVTVVHELEVPVGLPCHVPAETAAMYRHDAPPRRLRTSTWPSAWPTRTRSAVPRKRPVSTTPAIARIAASSLRAVPASARGAPGAQSSVRLPLSVWKGVPSVASRTVGVRPSARSSRETR